LSSHVDEHEDKAAPGGILLVLRPFRFEEANPHGGKDQQRADPADDTEDGWCALAVLSDFGGHGS
jgi:hypothetical protein